MDKQDLRDLLRKEYENGAGITELCRKYNQSINTVKSWKKRDGWKKKQINAPLTNAPPKKKSAPKIKKGAIEKEIKIQQDILEGKTPKEVMEQNDISRTTYYRKSKNARQIRLERTEEHLKEIIDEVYPDLSEYLVKMSKAKKNTITRIINSTIETNIDDKQLNKLGKHLELVLKAERELLRTGKMLTSYELLEIDKQLNEEELQQQKLDIERLKNEDEVMKDTKVEFNFKTDKVKELEEKKNDKE